MPWNPLLHTHQWNFVSMTLHQGTENLMARSSITVTRSLNLKNSKPTSMICQGSLGSMTLSPAILLAKALCNGAFPVRVVEVVKYILHIALMAWSLQPSEPLRALLQFITRYVAKICLQIFYFLQQLVNSWQRAIQQVLRRLYTTLFHKQPDAKTQGIRLTSKLSLEFQS